VACNAKHEVSRCSKSVHPTLSYALTAVICVPFEASFQAGWFVLSLYIGNDFTFSLVYHFSIRWIYSFLDDFADF
jgi:hypothetical protein